MVPLCVRALVLTVVVSALRHYEDDLAHEDVADVVEDQFAELSLNWTRPLTPRLHPEARAELQRKRGESMIQMEKGCKPSKFRAMGKKLGEGAYAAVYKVEGKSQSYAMKVPHEGDAEADEAAEHEIEVMSAAKEHHCQHVLPLIEKNPCINGTKHINAIVTKLLPFDFDKWQKDYKVPSKCYQRVFDALRDGLDCMHGSGYMHGDLKPDNILFEDFDDDGCPTGVQLADFGISRKLSSLEGKFDGAYFMGSWHLPGTVFTRVEDPLKLSKGKSFFTPDRRIDECSFALLMFRFFKRRVSSIVKDVGKGACGPMGPGRKLMMP